MDTQGTLKGVSQDFLSDGFIISFSISALPSDIRELGGYTLDISARRHREKRSLSANAYFHVLVSKIAEKLGSSITEVKNGLIAEYGQIDPLIKTIIMLDTVDWKKVEAMHLRPTTATRVLDNGKLYRVYYVMRGSHTYDTAEMSRLIDATVEAAREQGIETLTPVQIERMKAAWTGRD